MPYIITKKPYSEPKLVLINSKTLTEICSELNFRGTHESIGTGLLILAQTFNEFDEPNIFFNGACILGTVYVVRAGKEKIMDADHSDIEYFYEVISAINSFDY